LITMNEALQLLAAARALKRRWRMYRPNAFRAWAAMATEEEEAAAVELLVALDLGERRH
jgi:hypothetical protein